MFPLKDNLRYETFPLVTTIIVALNILLYIGEMTAGSMGVMESVLHPLMLSRADFFAGLASGDPMQMWHVLYGLFIPMFLHSGFDHIFGNMCFFFAFAPALEARMGWKKFLSFYLIGGVLANVAQMMSSATPYGVGLGASGAIGAVLGAYIVLFPRAEIEGWIPMSPLPLPFVSSGFFFLFDFLLMQVISIVLDNLGMLSGEEAHVGYGAHLGGIGFGIICAVIMRIYRRRHPFAVPPVVTPPRPDRPRYLFEIMQDVPVAIIGFICWAIGAGFRYAWKGFKWCLRMVGVGLWYAGFGIAWFCRRTGLAWLARRIGLVWLATKLWRGACICARPFAWCVRKARGLRLPFRKAAVSA